MQHLADSWLRTLRSLGARGDVAGAGIALLGRWAEPHRRYHDTAHLRAVLGRVDAVAGPAAATDGVRLDVARLDVVRLAAWFHDAVYDPQAADNEARSALVAADVLGRLRLGDDVVAEVVRLVLLTTRHDPPPDDTEGAVLCDADLGVLAAPGPEYAAYVTAVRAEYDHLDDAAFAAGRSAVLRSLLDRPALFGTEHGRREWEAPARANLREELSRYS